MVGGKRHKGRIFAVFVIGIILFMPVAYADIASISYVDSIVNSLKVQSDWNQTDSTAIDYIKNKPNIPDVAAVEYTANKTTTIDDTSTDTQYPTARAVNSALATKAASDDIRFNTIPTTRPSGTPPSGQVFIWFE